MQQLDELLSKCLPIEPIKITVDYVWIISELRRRLGYLPNDIESCLIDMDKEQLMDKEKDHEH